MKFRLDREEGFNWIGEVDITAEELISGNRKMNKQKIAEKFLREILADGSLPATEIYILADKEGIKEKTLRNAKDELGIDVKKKKNKWYWELKLVE